jgi:hypothetical protein
MKEPWWRTTSRLLWWTATRILAPFFALGLPVLVAYGLLHPRASDLSALRLREGEVALLIGTSAVSRSYVVLPRSLPSATVSTVDYIFDVPSVRDSPGQALFVVLIWGLFAYCTWYFWIRPLIRDSSQE